MFFSNNITATHVERDLRRREISPLVSRVLPGPTILISPMLSQPEPIKIRIFKVVIITNLEQKQKSASNAENTTDLPKTLQVPSLCFFFII